MSFRINAFFLLEAELLRVEQRRMSMHFIFLKCASEARMFSGSPSMGKISMKTEDAGSSFSVIMVLLSNSLAYGKIWFLLLERADSVQCAGSAAGAVFRKRS